MSDPTTFPITLHVRAHSDSFATSYSLPFDDNLHRELADRVGNDAIIAVESEPDHPLVLAGVCVVPDLAAEQAGLGETAVVFDGEFTTATVTLMATVDYDRFVGIYGLDPRQAVPQFIAARLLSDSVVLTENRGTLVIDSEG